MPEDPRRATIVVLQNAGGLPVPVFVDPHSLRVPGSLTALEWLPGLTRALHGGWPLGKPGSWLLEATRQRRVFALHPAKNAPPANDRLRKTRPADIGGHHR
jgi:hypothetical protein